MKYKYLKQALLFKVGSVTFIIGMMFMKDMDKYWKYLDSLFDSKDTRKAVWVGYAIGLVLAAASIYKLCLRLSGHKELSFEKISSLFLMLMVGISLVYFLFYRKKISIKIKFYLLCLVFACGGIDMFFHPKVSRRIRKRPNSGSLWIWHFEK